MNKKGIMMIKMTLFVIVSIFVGGLVIFGFSNVVQRLMINAEEEIAAKDIALTIMTLSASPNDISYRYDKNTENYVIRITGTQVQVTSPKGSGKYEYLAMNGVSVDDALIENALIIPLTLKNNVITFQDETVTYTDMCSKIPSNFDKRHIQVRLQVPEQSKNLAQIKQLISIYATTADSKIEFVEKGEDLLIILETGNAEQIKYYENTEDQSTSWYRKISCYVDKGIRSDKAAENIIQPFTQTPSSEKSITITFQDDADYTDAMNSDVQLAAAISKSIFDAIGLGLSY